MGTKLLRWAGLLPMVVALLGCSAARISVNDTLTPDDVAFIVHGTTTLAEVVAKLGPPNALAASDSGAVGTYHFLDLKYSRVNFGWLAKPWSPVSPDLVLSGTGIGTEAFEIVLDSRWVVSHHSFTRHSEGTSFKFWPF